MERLFDLSRAKVAAAPTRFQRFLIHNVDWSQRMIGIKGARGTGKTTMLLQQLQSLPPTESLYISLDDIYFTKNPLVYFAEEYARNGGTHLFLDEVHKYPNWSQELKNIYDSLPGLNIVFTSSSALEIQKGKYDLSRRALIYELPGLSYREFLQLKYAINLPVVTLDQILNRRESAIYDLLPAFKPYKYFSEYVQRGYYPYFTEDEMHYHIRLTETINQVLESDLPAIFNIDYESIIKLKKLLFIISTLVPYKPNINKLAEQVGSTRDTILRYIYFLHNAHIVRWLSNDAEGINFLNKPDKLYLENTNISFALGKHAINPGTMRETFFLNQLSVKHHIRYPRAGDFLVDNQYTFEVGGKNKSHKQIMGIEDSYIISDGIEYGSMNKLPLWVFGFLY
jgi:predicted AAA+ superfamily ATPase